MTECYISVTSNKSQSYAPRALKEVTKALYSNLPSYILSVSTSVGHVTSSGITVLSSCHHSQCSPSSHRAFVIYLTVRFSYPYVSSLLLPW